MRNTQDAFSHSEQCDSFFSIPSPIVGGVPHKACRCWCHGSVDLYATPDGPEIDLTPPPEYLTSADRPFLNVEPAHVRDAGRIALTEPEPEPGIPAYATSYLNAVTDAVATIAPPVSRTGYSAWSRDELVIGKCNNCGDPLAACECVE